MSEVGDPSKAKQDDQPGNFDDLVETLSQFDIDGKGMVQAAELRHILTALGNPLTDDEVDQVFDGQVNSEGQINIVEFVRTILS